MKTKKTLACGAMLIMGVGTMQGCSEPYDAREHGDSVYYTFAEQVGRGAEVYGASCSDCHGNAGQGTSEAPRLVGEGAFPKYPRRGAARQSEFRTALDVAVFVTENMPPDEDDRAAMPASDAWAVLAFALSANGVSLEEPVGPAHASEIVLNP